MRPEPVRITLPRRERSFDMRLREVRLMLAQARPEQILRLMDDIRDNGASDDHPSTHPRGTA
ncbi:hypothetical protein ACROSR_12970 [Roseovarius tibetensis]